MCKMNQIPLTDDRTVTVAYLNKACKSALRSEMYDCREPSCLFLLLEFLAQRQIGSQMNFHTHHAEYIFQIKIYTGDKEPRIFRGRHRLPQVAAAIALMYAVEEPE